MWEIYEKRTLIKVLRKAPKKILEYYEAWKRIVEIEGPEGLKLIKGFQDEKLKGKWREYQSSRLSRKWRVIYKFEEDNLIVFVIEITPHTY
jgi:toxin HigB-1